jgi:GTP cyclohydrolase-4
MHTVYLGLGSNLGDRQGNILQALQKLRASATIDAVSSYYETAPAGGARGPNFLNVAAAVRTELDPQAFAAFLRSVEIALGRQRAPHLSSRPIDIDLLLCGDVTGDFGHFELPHPYLAERPFNLVPLAEIAPAAIEPRSGETVGALAARVPATAGIVKKARALHFFANRQEEEPDVKLSIDRVGVSSVKRIVRLSVGGRETVFNGEFSMVADLAPDKAGVHMSRFSELLEEAMLDVLARSERPARIEDVVAQIAQQIVGSQKALRADVRLRAEFGLERWTPVSGKRGEETYALIGIAHADGSGARRAIGVEAEGMTACPCAQSMVREHSLRELREAGFSEADANRALDALPVATHNQRGRGSILIGTGDARDLELDIADLVDIVENSMSSETYDLLKRPDEFFIVNKAHHNPKFVEDVVRGILARALDVYADFPDHTFVQATEINFESIHKHDAFAEAFGTFGELRRELRTGRYDGRKTDLAGWLGTRPSSVVATGVAARAWAPGPERE